MNNYGIENTRAFRGHTFGPLAPESTILNCRCVFLLKRRTHRCSLSLDNYIMMLYLCWDMSATVEYCKSGKIAPSRVGYLKQPPKQKKTIHISILTVITFKILVNLFIFIILYQTLFLNLFHCYNYKKKFVIYLKIE